MTIEEVVFFINHKYGEQIYIVDTNKELRIFTTKSQWKIIYADKIRFGQYTLFHFNNIQGYGMHVQMKANDLSFLVYQAAAHDNTEIFPFAKDWKNFKENWNLYLLGRECEERAAAWDWLCGKELK